MTRRKIPKKIVYQTFNRIDNPNSKGHCWHCGKKLIFKNRKNWHVDHYPVQYKDIENQIIIGITDPLNPKNLVPSCSSCNLSHKYEISRWYFCNNSQFPCKKKLGKQIIIILIFIYLISITYLYFNCRF